jgi:hypothetical protein
MSHLSDESRRNLRSQGIQLLANLYQRPLFDYISFCRYLNTNEINMIIETKYSTHEMSKISIVKNEIFNLFISGNAKFTHLYIPYQFDFQIHLIPGAKQCFSELEFLHCNTSINDNVLFGLTELCESIRELELFSEYDGNNYKIVKLIEAPKKLYNISFQSYCRRVDKSFYAILENSLIKHASTIQYFKINQQPVTKILSSFVNLKRLELEGDDRRAAWNCLTDLCYLS